MTFRLLKSGSYGKAATENPDTRGSVPQIRIANSSDEYASLWRQHVDENPPAVDFSRETVVFLLLGVKSSGGYSITPKSVDLDSATARVVAAVNSPGGDSIVTMALTSPFAVIAVDRPAVHSGEWRGGDERVIARTKGPPTR